MSAIKTDIGPEARAVITPFAPSATIPETDVQRAIERVASLTGASAPVSAEYLVGTANVTLTAERVVTDSASVSWDLSTPGQALASVIVAGITSGVRAALGLFTDVLDGLVPATGGASGRFLKDDGTWAAVTASVAITEVEIDFGTPARTFKKFSITDAGVTATSKILILQSGRPATGKSADENEFDILSCIPVPAAGSFSLLVTCLTGRALGKFKLNYTVG